MADKNEEKLVADAKSTEKTDSRIDQCDFIHVHEDIVKAVNEHMPDEELLYDLADFFKVFADSTRIKILYVLMQSEMCVCDIAQLLNASQSAISHQLRTLKQMQLVKFRREGKTVFYSLSDGHIQTILCQGFEHIREQTARQSANEEKVHFDDVFDIAVCIAVSRAEK